MEGHDRNECLGCRIGAIHVRKFARRGKPSPAAVAVPTPTPTPTPDVSANFGALTASGAGGVAVTGSSISSGDASGHWQISGGYLSPSSAGDTANLNGGPYSLVLNNGQTVSITISANVRSVRTLAQASTALSAAGSNTTVRFRDGTYTGTWTLSSLTKTGVTVDSDTPLGAALQLISLTSLSGITFKLKAKYDSPDLYSLGDCIVEMTDCDVTWDSYEIDGDSALGRDYRYEGFRIQGGAPVFSNGEIHHIRTGIKCDDDIPGDDTITGNVFHHIYEDGIQHQDHDLVIEGNIFHTFEGRSGKRWGKSGSTLSSFTGTISVGETLSTGSGTSKKVIVVAAVNQGTGIIDGYYNNYAFPQAGETYTGPSGTVTLGTQDNAFDGVHGDACQGINKTTTQARDITFKQNIIVRSEAYNFDALGNSNPQGGFFLPNYDVGAGGSDIGWGTVVVEGNLIIGCGSNGIDIDKAASATVINNTVLQAQYPTSTRTTIDIANSVATCYGNIGDNGSSGVIKDSGGNTLTLTDYDGDDNGGLPLLRAGQTTPFPDIYTYPQSKSSFIPQAGSSVDTAKCGALLADGSWRPTALPT